MAASVNDLFRKVARRFVSQVGAAGIADNTTTTGPLASVTGLPTDTGVDITFDRVDVDGIATAPLEETTTGVVSGTDLVDMIRAVEGTAQAHTAGKVAENLWNAITWNDAVDGILQDHNQSGFHKTLMDTNGNEWIKQTATASAVNELTIANAATGSSPVLSITGGDTNIGYDIKMKGTGRMRKPTVVEAIVGSVSTSLATGDGQASFIVPEELNGMNLTGVSAQVYTAGTTGTLDIQIRNHTDTADMLSTKLTIDSTKVSTATAATPAVINTSTDDVVTDDLITIDIDAVHTTPAKLLIVKMRFELP